MLAWFDSDGRQELHMDKKKARTFWRLCWIAERFQHGGALMTAIKPNKNSLEENGRGDASLMSQTCFFSLTLFFRSVASHDPLTAHIPHLTLKPPRGLKIASMLVLVLVQVTWKSFFFTSSFIRPLFISICSYRCLTCLYLLTADFILYYL